VDHTIAVSVEVSLLSLLGDLRVRLDRLRNDALKVVV
jgi:hypothetical protein